MKFSLKFLLGKAKGRWVSVRRTKIEEMNYITP